MAKKKAPTKEQLLEWASRNKTLIWVQDDEGAWQTEMLNADNIRQSEAYTLMKALRATANKIAKTLK